MDDKSVVMSRELLNTLLLLGLVDMEGLVSVCVSLVDM